MSDNINQNEISPFVKSIDIKDNNINNSEYNITRRDSNRNYDKEIIILKNENKEYKDYNMKLIEKIQEMELQMKIANLKFENVTSFYILKCIGLCS
jgi:hypothetical protein